jgi:hypothetical protein
VWHSDGSGWFEPPEPPTAIALTALFFLPIFSALLLASRRRKWTAYLFASALALAVIAFGLSHWTRAFVPIFGAWSALFLLFGIFWRRAGRQGWPPPLQPHSRSLSQRVAAFVVICVVVLSADIFVTFALSALSSSLFSPDCGEKPLIVRPESPYHAVFTARVIFVGRSMNTLFDDRSIFRDRQFSECGDWAIGVVQEKFWGLPSWSRLVLLTNYVYRKNAVYFVDGSRGRGVLARALPIVEGGISCSRTKLAKDAAVDLRALRGH